MLAPVRASFMTLRSHSLTIRVLSFVYAIFCFYPLDLCIKNLDDVWVVTDEGGRGDGDKRADKAEV